MSIRDLGREMTRLRRRIEGGPDVLPEKLTDAEKAKIEAEIDEARLGIEIANQAITAVQDQGIVWQIESNLESSLIVAGKHLIGGGKGRVTAWDKESGKEVWSADVDGTFTACPALSLHVEGLPVISAPTTRLGQSSTCLSITSEGLISFDLASGAVGAVLALPATFRLTDDTVTFALAVDGTAHVVDRQGRRIGSIWTTT